MTLWSLWSRDLGNGLALLAFVKYVKLSIGKLLKLEFQTSLDFLSWLSNILNDWKIDFFHSKSQEFQAFQVSSSNVLWSLQCFKVVCIGMRLHFFCAVNEYSHGIHNELVRLGRGGHDKNSFKYYCKRVFIVLENPFRKSHLLFWNQLVHGVWK